MQFELFLLELLQLQHQQHMQHKHQHGVKRHHVHQRGCEMSVDLKDELRMLESTTFEIEELTDPGMELAATSSSCSCSSCCSCSTSSTCGTSTSTT